MHLEEGQPRRERRTPAAATLKGVAMIVFALTMTVGAVLVTVGSLPELNRYVKARRA